MPSTVSNDANSIMPLLFAAHPDLIPNYRRMAAMDDLGRTQSALEHKFRAWRQDGKKILAEKCEDGNVKSVSKEAGSVGGGAVEKSNQGKSVSHNSAATTTRKRALSDEHEIGGVGGEPVKKPRIIKKKGIARKVKKATPKPRESEEEVTTTSSSLDDEEKEEEKEEKTLIGKKGARKRSNAVSYGKGVKKDIKGVEGGEEEEEEKKEEEEKEEEEKEEEEKEEEEGLVEMGFDLE